jgi:hypothetical protein
MNRIRRILAAVVTSAGALTAVSAGPRTARLASSPPAACPAGKSP